MRVAFAGTPAFARAALARMHGAGFEITLVLTQPDRPAGRGLRLQASPVKEWAAAHDIEVLQPAGLRLDGRHASEAAHAREALLRTRCDVMVVAAYGLILPRWVLALPAQGCINIHASLLPRWRGAAPIHRALEAGDTTSGVTIMQMDEGLDTGPMLLVQALPIGPEDTTGSLQDRLADLGAGLVVRALSALPGLEPVPQPAEGVTYAHKIGKAEAAIDWRESAAVIERRLRAFDPFPGATGVVGGEIVKCWRGRVVTGAGEPGEILAVGREGVRVACGEAALELTELQRAGGRRLPAAEFLKSTALREGMRFADPERGRTD